MYVLWIEVEIPRGRIGLNYLSLFVFSKMAVWLMYLSSWILVSWKFYCLTNSNASSVYTNWCMVLTSVKKSLLLICLMFDITLWIILDSTTGGQPAYPPLPPLYPNYPPANDHYPSPYPPPPSHYSAPTTPPTTTTTTEVPSYRYPPTESPYPDYNPRVDTHAHQQYPYPRYPQQHQHRSIF